MPFIEQAVSEATEGYFVEEDEYDLRIVSVEEKESKKGKPMIECVIEIVDHPDAEPVFFYLNLTHPDDSEKARKFKLRMMRRFLEVFNIPFDDSGFDTDDLQGAEGRCVVFQQERVDENGEAFNPPEFSHALRLPKFGGGEEEQEATPRGRAVGRGGTPAGRGRGAQRPEPEPEEEAVEEEEVYEEEPIEEEPVEEDIPEEEPEEEPPPPPVRRPARPSTTAAKQPARGGPPPRRR